MSCPLLNVQPKGLTSQRTVTPFLLLTKIETRLRYICAQKL